jgi:hypothetical protein
MTNQAAEYDTSHDVQDDVIDSFELTSEQRAERYRYDEEYNDWADIYRVFQDGRPRKLLYNAVKVSEAKKYCSDPKTEGKDWFDCWESV